MEDHKNHEKHNQQYLVGCDADASPKGAFHVTVNRKNFTFSDENLQWLLTYFQKYSEKDCYAYCIEKNKDGSTHLHYASIGNRLPHCWRKCIRKHFDWDNNSKTINIKSKYTETYTWRNVVGEYLTKSAKVSHKGIHPKFMNKGKVTYTDHVTIKKAKSGVKPSRVFSSIIAYARNHDIKNFRKCVNTMRHGGIPFAEVVQKYYQEQWEDWERTFNVLINDSKDEDFTMEQLYKPRF